MNTLDQLEPLVRPAPVAFWPLAPGWWLIAALVFLLALLVFWLCYRRPRPESAGGTVEEPLDVQRNAALAELNRLPRPYDQPAGPWLQALNMLLKRLCISRYPDSHCQSMNGRAWLAFLDTRCPAAGLTRWMVLVNGAYRPDCRMDDKAIDELHAAVAIWIRKHV
ncbi:uncharacterized protein DUF4381 [Pseudomonas duriflava]|uniref:Uncharacterized protein DUF4381 n=1 Tax=Pseudomonas duriflava TaxID=459528 RepID=A0A562QAT7_9PSED|nr:DUF4381 domain-containing protein [Pseudomonas duriflava]TWI53871.1 uncharacterized protein DUF4381 [Pseudomonas duriflava]